MKKEETVITLKNGGMHSQTNYRKCKDMIRNHNYSIPRLYHLVFKGSDTKEAYLLALNALCEEMRNNKIPCKWKACFEVDEDKGLHLHAFVLLDAKHGRPDYYIRYAEDGWLVLMLKELGLSFHISQPKNKIHRTATGKKQNYAYVTKTGPKLDDALIWCSYLYKVRSKDDSMKTIYHSSRGRAQKLSDSPSAALPAAQEAVAVNHSTSDHSTSVMANLESACSAVDVSPMPKGASTSANSCLMMARAMDRDVASPDASSITISRLMGRNATVYEMRNLDMADSAAVGVQHHNSDALDNATDWDAAICRLPLGDGSKETPAAQATREALNN